MRTIEMVNINGNPTPHEVIVIRGDGACLFRSLSFLMYGTDAHVQTVRAQIVHYVRDNWNEDFKTMSHNALGDNYENANVYFLEMIRPQSYGGLCELTAAGMLYDFVFEVYKDGQILGKFGYEGYPVRRLRFTGTDLSWGHFDAYTLINSQNPIKILKNDLCSPTPMNIEDWPPLPPVELTEIHSFNAAKEENLLMVVDEENAFVPSPGKDSVEQLQPKQKHKRRARFTDATRKKQLKEAAHNFKTKHPLANQAVVAKYTKKHPDVHRTSVAKYTQKNPEVHRTSVAKYTLEKPEVHRASVAKYSKEHPEIHSQSSKVYGKNNPEVSRRSSARHDPTGEKRSSRRSLPWKNKNNSGFNYDSDINYESDSIVLLGKMEKICTFCRALKWKEESAGMCCSSGKVQLSSMLPLPEPLKSLILGDHPEHCHFMDRVRKYNGCFQMTSFGAKNLTESGFMPTFKVQGQVYHRIGSLYPSTEEDAKFLQIYFVGEDEREVKLRCDNFAEVKSSLVKQLQEMLHETNLYIKELKSAISKVQVGDKFEVVIHADRKPAGSHVGRFNSPVVNEVAIVMVGQEFEKRDIVLHSHDNKIKRISEIHRAYDTLQYPLLFCHGEDGYHICISQHDPSTKLPLRKTVSAASFYSYRIMKRLDEFNPLLYFRSLFSQFLVDMYAKIETERLNFIRNNQAKLRADNYVHLQDAVGRQDANASDLGQVVVLPSSFTGGPRYMHARTQDALTYVRQYGRPDLFITFTCNTKWADIQDQLLPGQKPHDRHDLIARVFHLKVKRIMAVLTKGCVFGEVKCFMYSVEWQKRGLPHIHILLWLEQRISPNTIDNVISAEVPHPETDPVLYEIVKKNMIHGPCGSFNHKSPCMVNGVCSKKYPRKPLKETQTGEDGYPQYRRRSVTDGGNTVDINGTTVDNRWVVPYNPVLLRTFNGHINVEYCSSVKSIKYVCKYINKGSDQAAFVLKNDQDEVSLYESGRYISSSEAVWRIFGFPIHERHPTVVHLAVHLENGQRVYFTSDNLAEKISNPPSTTLLAFFDLCKVDDFAKNLLYSEVPSFFVWTNGKFIRRKKGKDVVGWPGVKKDAALGRVYTVHPNNTECFHLRMLLHVVHGPTSFDVLKTVNGVLYPTYLLACKAHGLLEDDHHWKHTLEEAVLAESPRKIRELFVVMLVFCQVSDPSKLWETFKDHLSEDILWGMGTDQPISRQELSKDAYNQCLLLIEDSVLMLGGQRLVQFGLPQPKRSEQTLKNLEYLRETNYDPANLALLVEKNQKCLTRDQRVVYESLTKSIESNSGKVFFLDAPGGTGKTFIINLILAKVRSSRAIALAVASSGIAATLLEGGRTAHAAFKLPLNLLQVESPTCNIQKQSHMAKVLKECKLIVWDESTMANKGGFEALDRTLKDIRDNSDIMGGVTVLLAGDFRQTLPVVPRGTRADEVKACIKSSFLWPHMSKLTLSTNMRVHLGGNPSAQQFSSLILAIGDGDFPETDGRIHIPDKVGSVVCNLTELISKIYPDIKGIKEKSTDWLLERAILTPRNDKVTEINNILLNSFVSTEMRYKSIDSVLDPEEAVHFPLEFLNTLDPPGLPSHELRLKIGAPVMLLRNLNPPKLCNGTRLQVKALHKNVIEATVFTGCATGESVFIPRIPLIPSNYQIPFKRLQFPLKLCFAMTINKSQGQSLKSAGIDLREDCFSHGQLYVACSRVSCSKSLVFLAPDNKTTNVVYKEVLK